MSTNSECMFIERKPGQWFYALENCDAPKNSFDWIEHAQAFGPFKSFDVAREHLRANHANPGGYHMVSYEDHTKQEERPALKQLLDKANRGEMRWLFG